VSFSDSSHTGPEPNGTKSANCLGGGGGGVGGGRFGGGGVVLGGGGGVLFCGGGSSGKIGAEFLRRGEKGQRGRKAKMKSG